MKKHYFLFGVLLASSFAIAWQNSSMLDMTKIKTSHTFVNGAPTGRTGAPGELTCATSGCHGGSAMDGSTENVFVATSGGIAVTSYVPGETYTIGLSLASAPTKKGFQATVLDGTNTFAGTLTPLTAGGTASAAAMGRTYINHTSLSSVSPAWAFEWTAPATDVGAVRFYVTTNKTNNNGNNSGDEIFSSIHVLGSTAGLEENTSSKVSDFNASFSASNSTIHLSYSSLINGTSNVNIVDMSGRTVFNTELNPSTIGLNKDLVRIPESIKNGMYVVHFFVDNAASSKVISIQK